uniref:Uncharacterized protein n=1 Tax=Panagrolaimus superbus TaxID=310955 RepID=A0A914YPZ2_9BILA
MTRVKWHFDIKTGALMFKINSVAVAGEVDGGQKSAHGTLTAYYSTPHSVRFVVTSELINCNVLLEWTIDHRWDVEVEVDESEGPLVCALNAENVFVMKILSRHNRNSAADAISQAILPGAREEILNEAAIEHYAREQEVVGKVISGKPLDMKQLNLCTIVVPSAKKFGCLPFHLKAGLQSHVWMKWAVPRIDEEPRPHWRQNCPPANVVSAAFYEALPSELQTNAAILRRQEQHIAPRTFDPANMG